MSDYFNHSETITADTAGTSWHPLGGGEFQIAAYGSLGGGTLTLQITNDTGSGNVVDTDKDGAKIFEVTDNRSAFLTLGPCYVRFVMTSSTTPSCTVTIRRCSGTTI